MLRGWFAIIVVVGTVAFARADGAADKKRAGELAAQSAEHYKRGEFEVSVALLRQAYTLYPEPNLLYNLARSLEGLGEKQEAVDAYEKYLAAATKIDDRGAIERRVSILKAELAARAPKPEPPKPSPPPPPPPIVIAPKPAPPIVREDRAEPRASKIPWVVIAAGVAIAGTGAYFGWQAGKQHDDAVDAMAAADAERLQDNAEQSATIANVLFVVGGAVVVGGVVWKIIDRPAKRTSATAQAHIGPGTIALEVAW